MNGNSFSYISFTDSSHNFGCVCEFTVDCWGSRHGFKLQLCYCVGPWEMASLYWILVPSSIKMVMIVDISHDIGESNERLDVKISCEPLFILWK